MEEITDIEKKRRKLLISIAILVTGYLIGIDYAVLNNLLNVQVAQTLALSITVLLTVLIVGIYQIQTELMRKQTQLMEQQLRILGEQTKLMNLQAEIMNSQIEILKKQD
jgi:hypothetical protein